jgi:hypothetical protein
MTDTMTWRITESQRREQLTIAVMRDRLTGDAERLARISTILSHTPPDRARDLIRRGTPYVGVLIDNWRNGRFDLAEAGYLVEDHAGRTGITPDLKPFRAFTAAHPMDECMLAGHRFLRVDRVGRNIDPRVHDYALSRVRP